MKYTKYNKNPHQNYNNSNNNQGNHLNPEIINETSSHNQGNFEENIIGMSEKTQFDFNNIKKLSLKELQTYIKTQLNNFHPHNIGNKELLLCELIKFLNHQYALKITGCLEIIQDNYGFLRHIENNFLNSKYDIYVSPQYIKKYDLRNGDIITCIIVNKNNQVDKFIGIYEILEVSGVALCESSSRDIFEYLTPQYPHEQIILERENETNDANHAMRALDLICPIGKGQRMLIVSQPKSGKTTLLQQMAIRMSEDHKLTLIVLLIDERPEEVTDMKRILPKNSNVMIISSTFDQEPETHIQISKMVFNMAKRMVENKQHVVVMLDSLTRLARAYNNQMPHSGKTLTGGFDSKAIQEAKACLGAARNIEEGGSLTIVGTVLNNTGSKGDDIVYEELKSTGNSEVELARSLSQKGLFPAILIGPSSTRKVEFFLHPDAYRRLKILWNLMLNSMSSEDAIIWLFDMIKNTTSNKMLFEQMNKNSNIQRPRSGL